MTHRVSLQHMLLVLVVALAAICMWNENSIACFHHSQFCAIQSQNKHQFAHFEYLVVQKSVSSKFSVWMAKPETIEQALHELLTQICLYRHVWEYKDVIFVPMHLEVISGKLATFMEFVESVTWQQVKNIPKYEANGQKLEQLFRQCGSTVSLEELIFRVDQNNQVQVLPFYPIQQNGANYKELGTLETRTNASITSDRIPRIHQLATNLFQMMLYLHTKEAPQVPAALVHHIINTSKNLITMAIEASPNIEMQCTYAHFLVLQNVYHAREYYAKHIEHTTNAYCMYVRVMIWQLTFDDSAQQVARSCVENAIGINAQQTAYYRERCALVLPKNK